MIDQGRHNLLGVYIHAVDYEAAIAQIIAAALAQRAFGVSALAVHGVMTGVQDRQHAYRLNHLHLVVPDGQPVRWAINWLYGTRLRNRVYGPNLMLRVCERAADEQLPVYFYGSQRATLDRLTANLQRRFPKLVIAGAQPSRFRPVTPAEKAEIVAEIQASGARMVMVGLGCPRQEIWVYEHLTDLSMPMVAVGAAFDFHAGIVAQAPPSLQRLGLEWLYRLSQEPQRLWKRYILLNPQYLALLSAQALGWRKFDPAHDPAPTEMRYIG